MNTREIEHMWKVASNNPNHDTNWHDPIVVAFAALVRADEREAIAKEFDRRAVQADGTLSSGWYEPDEPAQIIRRGTTPPAEQPAYRAVKTVHEGKPVYVAQRDEDDDTQGFMPDWANFQEGRAVGWTEAFERIAEKVKLMPWENDTKDSFLIWLKEQE
jgi:hypothetical protein